MTSSRFAAPRVAPSFSAPSARTRRLQGGLAFAIYLALAIVLVGRGARHGVSSATLGMGPDVQIFVWGLAWWPHAIGHGLDPLHPTLVWPPQGGALLWSTTVPLLSVLAAPLTLAFGPAATWNLLVVLAPAAAGWSAWLLCSELEARPAPAIVGGALFGFGGFVAPEDIAHLQLSACPLLAVGAWVALRGVRRATPSGRLALASAAITVAQFLICPELLVTLGLMALVALAGAMTLAPWRRAAVLRTARAMAVGALGGAVLISPLVVEMLTHVPRSSSGAVGWPVDLLGFVIPTARFAVGGAAATGISTRFPGDLAEQTGYLGAPLVLVLGAWGWRHRRETGPRLLLGLLAVSLVLACGSRLTVDGHRTIWLPWALLAHLPFLRDALPARMMVYAWLLAATILARWLSDRSVSRVLRGLALVAIAASLVPAAWPRQPEPSAVVSPSVRAALRGQRVISLPFFDVHERGLLVQEAARFRFSLIDSWLQLRPRGFAPQLPGTALTYIAIAPLHRDATARLVDELRAAGITRVLLWRPIGSLTRALGPPIARAGSVTVLRVR